MSDTATPPAADPSPATLPPPPRPGGGVGLFTVFLTFDVQDPETVARVRFNDVPARSHDLAVLAALEKTVSGGGFTEDDLIEVTVTRANPGVKRNLLAQHI